MDHMIAMEVCSALFLIGYAFLLKPLCAAEVECVDALHWKAYKALGPYCYRYFTGDERSVYVGALAVCRFLYNATLIDKLPTMNESKLLGIDQPTWIANKEDNNFSLDWDVRADTCYQMIGRDILSTIEGNCNSESHKAKVMCEAEREFIDRNATQFPNEGYQYRNMPTTEGERFTFREAAAFCIKHGRLVHKMGRVEFANQKLHRSFRYWDCEPPCWLWNYKRDGVEYFLDEAIGSLQNKWLAVIEPKRPHSVRYFTSDIYESYSFLCRRASIETKTSQQPEPTARQSRIPASGRRPTTRKVVSLPGQQWSWLLMLLPFLLILLLFVMILAPLIICAIYQRFHSHLIKSSSHL